MRSSLAVAQLYNTLYKPNTAEQTEDRINVDGHRKRFLRADFKLTTGELILHSHLRPCNDRSSWKCRPVNV